MADVRKAIINPGFSALFADGAYIVVDWSPKYGRSVTCNFEANAEEFVAVLDEIVATCQVAPDGLYETYAQIDNTLRFLAKGCRSYDEFISLLREDFLNQPTDVETNPDFSFGLSHEGWRVKAAYENGDRLDLTVHNNRSCHSFERRGNRQPNPHQPRHC